MSYRAPAPHQNPFAGPPAAVLQRMAPPTTVRPFTGPFDTLKVMAAHALGPRGEQSTIVRQFTEAVVRDIQPKDYLGEIIAVRNVFVQPPPPSLSGFAGAGSSARALFRYTNDPRHVEMVKDPERLIQEVLLYGSVLLDCDDSAQLAGTMCLILGREIQFVAMGFAPQELSHVCVRVKEPKSSQWIVLDGVAGPREKEAQDKAKELLYWSLD
jgi:hypothetical protein